MASCKMLLVKPRIKGTLGPVILSFVERLSSSQRLKMSYCYRKDVQKSGVLFVERLSYRPFLRVPFTAVHNPTNCELF